jgi:hypothetical protein
VATARLQGCVAILADDIGLADASTDQDFTVAMSATTIAGRVAYGLTALTDDPQ